MLVGFPVERTVILCSFSWTCANFAPPCLFSSPTTFPIFSSSFPLWLESFLFSFLIFGVYYVYKQLSEKSEIIRYSSLILLVIVCIMPTEITIPNIFINILWTVGLFWLIRYFWQGNPWGYFFGVLGFFYLPSLFNDFYQVYDESYRIQLFALVFCIGTFFIYFINIYFVTF